MEPWQRRAIAITSHLSPDVSLPSQNSNEFHPTAKEMKEKTVAFIGAGLMATALAGGMIQGGVISKSNIIASDLSPQALSNFKQKTGGALSVSNSKEAVSFQGKGIVDVIVLAVKPQVMPIVLDQLSSILSSLRSSSSSSSSEKDKKPLIISIAAGVRLKEIEKRVGEKERIIRVMPNTPALVQEAAFAFSLGGSATVSCGDEVKELFGPLGICCPVGENLMDAVVGVSGSGPAYVYLFIEALSDAGVRQGLPRPLARQLAVQTVLGSARMVQETGLHTGTLKDQVTSPGGTTIAGVEELEKGGVRAAVFAAVRAATQRSRELGQS